MNYQAYRAFKESLSVQDFLRLDCMNPYKAMSYYKAEPKPCSKQQVREQLRPQWPVDHLSFSKGVRAALPHIAAQFSERAIYLPQEVYPVYFELLKTHATHGYSIFNTESLSEISHSVILYTWNHFGELQLDELLIKKLIAQDNILVIDAVYDYANECLRYRDLIESGRLILLYSHAKTQLHRHSGYVLHNILNNGLLTFDEPDEWLCFDPGFAEQQLMIFEHRWLQINDSVNLAIWKTKHPYFRIVKEPFASVLDRNILGIPLSVFSNNHAPDFTVLSCLYEIHKHIPNENNCSIK